MVEPLIVGRWYWVKSSESDHWFPAQHDPGADGGWTNNDTWTDIHHEIVEWCLIPESDA